MPELIAVAGLRWKVEENNEAGKDLLGLTDYQVRTWVGWHRHVTTVMLALAFLAVSRRPARGACPQRAGDVHHIPCRPGKRPPAPGEGRLTALGLIRPSLAEIRRVFARLVVPANNLIDHVLAWSQFRQEHQTRALISHYRQRGDPPPQDLRM
ncbi:hypothetical protein ACFMQL_14585 [Nonomuraea fastidiosa]|uniref:hypothetical protein n=1 Tax=Nonomuraea TaxID=83681 RepID=UPI0032448AF0